MYGRPHRYVYTATHPCCPECRQSLEVTSERVNMSVEILEKHYDATSVTEKAERRRDLILDI